MRRVDRAGVVAAARVPAQGKESTSQARQCEPAKGHRAMKFTPNRLPAKPTPLPRPDCVDCGRDLLTRATRLAGDGAVRNLNRSTIARRSPCNIRKVSGVIGPPGNARTATMLASVHTVPTAADHPRRTCRLCNRREPCADLERHGLVCKRCRLDQRRARDYGLSLPSSRAPLTRQRRLRRHAVSTLQPRARHGSGRGDGGMDRASPLPRLSLVHTGPARLEK